MYCESQGGKCARPPQSSSHSRRPLSGRLCRSGSECQQAVVSAGVMHKRRRVHANFEHRGLPKWALYSAEQANCSNGCDLALSNGHGTPSVYPGANRTLRTRPQLRSALQGAGYLPKGPCARGFFRPVVPSGWSFSLPIHCPNIAQLEPIHVDSRGSAERALCSI